MQVKLQAATTEDAESIAALRNAISDDLTFKLGRGPWTAYSTTAAVLADLRSARLFVALHRGEVIASLKLSTTKPLSIDLIYFPKVTRPCYLSAIAVSPELQRQGIGRACLNQAAVLARREKTDAILIEAVDHPTAGTGPFFAKCGYRETGRATHRGSAVVYFEMLLRKTAPAVRKQNGKA
ncbi:MAG: GNAT family N-acetyltransferase [Lacunisphaera sp.]